MPYARPLLVLALLSGASSLLYQVVWSRLLTLEIGLTAAALSTVLAAFMGGLALGTFAASRRAATLPPRRALALYGLLELAVGITALGVAPALTLARPILAITYHDGEGGLLFAILRLVICLIVVTVPATLMGATFPLALRWLEPRPNEPAARAGQIAGLFYAVHTFGAALGAAVTGFLLLPALGLTALDDRRRDHQHDRGRQRLRPPVASPRGRWPGLDARRHIAHCPTPRRHHRLPLRRHRPRPARTRELPARPAPSSCGG